MTRVLRLVACLALLVGSTFVVAAPVAAHNPHSAGACDVFTSGPMRTGTTSSSSTHDRNGVAGIIDPYTLQTCGSGGLESDFSAMWLGVYDRTDPGNEFRVFAVGVVNCGGAVPRCYGAQPHYFFYKSGCGTTFPVPIDLGTVSDGSTDGLGGMPSRWFQIGKSSQNNNWYIWIDKNRDGDMADYQEQVYTLDDADPATQCWINVHQKGALFMGERGDSGSGLGDWGSSTFSHHNFFLSTMYQTTAGGGWTDSNFNPVIGPPVPCSQAEDGDGQGYSYCLSGGPVSGQTNDIKIGTDFDGT